MGSIREERHQEGASHWLWWPQSHEELPNTPKHALFSQRGHQRMLPKPPGPCPGAAPRLAWVAACSWVQSRGLERDRKLHHNHAAPQQPSNHNPTTKQHPLAPAPYSQFGTTSRRGVLIALPSSGCHLCPQKDSRSSPPAPFISSASPCSQPHRTQLHHITSLALN